MASVNKAIIIGHLGRDPETRYTSGGDAVCNFSVATSESWNDKATGEKKEQTEWHRISTFGKVAEISGKYLKKGSQVYVEGSIHTRKWTDKDGQERYTTEIRGDVMRMLGSKDSQSSGGNYDSGGDQDARPPRQPRQPGTATGGFHDLGDDIPFAPINKRGALSHVM